MTKRNRREHRLPGNDGRWFLELVGAEQPPPDATTTLAELASPDPAAIPAAAATNTLGGHGGIVLGHDPGSETNGGIDFTRGLLLDDDDEAHDLDIAGDDDTASVMSDWEPEELSRSLLSSRTVRWTVVLFVVLLGAAVAVGIFWLPRAAEREAATAGTEMSAAMAELRNELPDAQGALALVTDPLTDDEALGDVIPATADLDAKAHTVSSLGAEELSSRLDFLPGDPLGELADTQDRMRFLGAGGEQIAARIGRGYVYRTTFPRLLQTPLLPASIGDSSAINQLSVSLASALADSVDLVADLPTDPAFASAQQAAIDAVDRFEEWIVDYLAALRNGDPEQVQELIREVDTLREDLDTGMTDGLLALRSEVDQQILDLASEAEAAIAAIPTF